METHELQIHTVYTSPAARGGPKPSVRLLLVAALTLAMSAAWMYVTWIPVGKRVARELTFGGMMLGALGSTPPAVKDKTDKDQPDSRTQAERKAATSAAGTRLGVITAGWFAVSSGVALWLAMAGAAGLVRGVSARRIGWWLMPLMVVAAVLCYRHVDYEYGWLESLTPLWAPLLLGGLILACAAALGMVLNRRCVGLLRLGGVVVILSACVTVGALWALLHWGGLPADQLDASVYAKAFAVQSAYGWVLLLATIRLR